MTFILLYIIFRETISILLMDFHFICLGSGVNATIVDVRDKPRFICFKDRKRAVRYATYLCEYKAKFGKWPVVNMSLPFIKVTTDGFVDNKTIDVIDIVYMNRRDLDKMSLMTGVNYFYCHDFEYEDLISFNISGQEIDGYADDILYREYLENSLKEV